MKKIAILLFNMLIILTAKTVIAQTSPTPPKKPVTVSVHSADGSRSYSYNETSSDDDGQGKNTNVSVSISNSEDTYSFRAKYPSNKYSEVKAMLDSEMSRNNLSTSNGKYIWVSDSDDEEVYKVVLSKTKLSMVLDKEVASSSLINKFENLGKDLRTIIAGPQNDYKRDAERLQREADKLRRNAEQMHREAERMQREAQRIQEHNVNRYKEDAERIAQHALRIAEEAAHLNTQASHKGGVSDVVKGLLNENRTYLKDNTVGGNNWHWPEAQRDFLAALRKDNLIDSKNDVNYVADQFGTYVNGNKLGNRQAESYKSLLAKHGIPKKCDFSFYKAGQHIVLVNSNPNVEEFLRSAVSKGLLASTSKKVTLEINGTDVRKNGHTVSSSELDSYNSLLIENNIIPVPGKTLEIMKSKSYKLGYSLGRSSHMGTWSMEN